MARAFTFVRWVTLAPVALASVQELSELLGAVKNAGSNTEESYASGFTGPKEGYTGDTQALGRLFLRK